MSIDKSENQKTAVAQLKYLKIAPRKTRLLASLLRNMSVVQAEAELLYRPQRASGPLLKLLRSAVSNAQRKEMKKEDLYVAEIRVDQGPMLKRHIPKARGSASMIQKKMSHVFLALKEKEEKKRPLSKKSKKSDVDGKKRLSKIDKKFKKVKYKAPAIKVVKSDKFVSNSKIKS